MQTCPIHNIPLKPLFVSFYCPLCTGTQIQEIKFENLSLEQQRVWFAKDVLWQLEQQKIIPKKGTFIESLEPGKCEVCALGALMVSCLAKRPGITSQENISALENDASRSFIHDFLSPFFDTRQLDLIEAAFEESATYALHYAQRIEQASRLYSNIECPEKRLILIMQNIIEHQGTFVVPYIIPRD